MQGKANSWIKTTLMLEEYLDGPEVDVDLVLSDGLAVYGAVTDNWPTVEPYFNETGSNSPSILPLHQQQGLMDLAVRSVDALGLKQVGSESCAIPSSLNRQPPVCSESSPSIFSFRHSFTPQMWEYLSCCASLSPCCRLYLAASLISHPEHDSV